MLRIGRTPCLRGVTAPGELQRPAMPFFTSPWHAPAPRKRSSGYVEPCLPTLSSTPPEGPQWIHEIKHDGYRLIVLKQDDRVRLFTRRGYDWTDRYPLIGEAV